MIVIYGYVMFWLYVSGTNEIWKPNQPEIVCKNLLLLFLDYKLYPIIRPQKIQTFYISMVYIRNGDI